MKILSIDTSSAALGIALSNDRAMLAEFTQNKALTHSEKLMPLIDTMMKNTDEDLASLDVVACTIGPGSFTGIRIGVATANAFAMAKSIPVIGISTLEALAWNFRYTDCVVTATMYAQRDDYYRGVYSFENGRLTVIKSEEAVSRDEILSEIREITETGRTVMLAGEMTDRYRAGTFASDEMQEMLSNGRLIIADRNLNFLRASNLCEMASQIMESSDISELPRYIEPVYIRKPQAEVQYEEKMARLRSMRDGGAEDGKQ